MKESLDKFLLHSRVAVITGGAGFLGVQHAEIVAEAGGRPVLWDLDGGAASREAGRIGEHFKVSAAGMGVDITDAEAVKRGLATVLNEFGRVDILINNAASDPKVGDGRGEEWSRLEFFPVKQWETDLAVGITGSFLCSQIVGGHMAGQGSGVILNVASDLALIAPDQRIYRKSGQPEDHQPAKPVSYSVVKHALIGLTKYLATYWAEKNIRVNAISPGGIYRDQPAEFVEKLTRLIPMGRMAEPDEYKAAVLFLISDASRYMTGANLIIDGGRTCW